MSILSRGMKASINHEKCDLVLKNAQYINVFTSEIQQGDIGIIEDTIIGIGNYDGINEIDCSGKFISPGFIDCHIHIESSMVTPELYGAVALKNGVTTVIADPHEIANVLGNEGINFMIKNSKLTDLDIYFMMPSCVPSVSFEENAGVLSGEDLAGFLENPKVIGLGEVMDVPAVINMDLDMIKKLNAFNMRNIDGHAPHISKGQLNQYILSGITTDHECSDIQEAVEKVNLGMYVLIREGSAAKNLKSLIGAVNNNNYHRFAFCTDDRHVEDLLQHGSINNAIKISIKEGLDPVKAYIMGSYNGYNCYGIKNRGAIAPGYKADLLVIDNLEDVEITAVIKNGEISNYRTSTDSNIKLSNTMNIEKVSEEDFKIVVEGNNVNIIEIIPNSLETKLMVKPSLATDNYLDIGFYEDILKVGVFERHKRTNHYSLGLLSGLGLKNCSIAQSVAHDSHNIIVVGDNDGDMAKAVNTLIDLGGGIVVVSNGVLINQLALEIGGVMTNSPIEHVYDKVTALNKSMNEYGLNPNIDAFITLSFMSLPVIPEIKLTTKGLFLYESFGFIPLFYN